jgi:hypothetical protein
LSENSVVAYVADHGEMLGQHGLWWKCTFYEGSTGIPYIISFPDRFAPGRRSSVTSLVDLTRTLLELAGADTFDVDGRSLTPLLNGSEPDGEGVAIAEYEAHGTILPARMVRRGRYKLNYSYGEKPELFDLQIDPHELSDLAEQPESSALREEFTAIALRDWDPAEIARQVRHSQRLRRTAFDGSHHLHKETWSPSRSEPEPARAAVSRLGRPSCACDPGSSGSLGHTRLARMWSALVKGNGVDRVANRDPDLLVARAEYSCPESAPWNVSRKPTARYGLPLAYHQQASRSRILRLETELILQETAAEAKFKIDRVQPQEKFADLLNHFRAAFKAHGFPVIPIRG